MARSIELRLLGSEDVEYRYYAHAYPIIKIK